MSFLNKMKKAGEALADKAKDLGDVASLKMEKSQLKADIEDLYIEIGKKIVEARDERFLEEIAIIEEKYARIEKIDEEVNDYIGKVKCPHCGKMIDDDHRFCPECGKEVG